MTPEQLNEIAAREYKMDITFTGPLYTQFHMVTAQRAACIKGMEVNQKAQRLLESLTPGGSEFVDDPERCVEFVKEQLSAAKQAVLVSKKGLEKMEEAAVAFGEWRSNGDDYDITDGVWRSKVEMFNHWYNNIYSLPTGENKKG